MARVAPVITALAIVLTAPCAWGQTHEFEFHGTQYTMTLVIAEDDQAFSVAVRVNQSPDWDAVTYTAERRRAFERAFGDLPTVLSEQHFCSNGFTLSEPEVTPSGGIINGKCKP